MKDKCERWAEKDTERFYDALAVCGTDFAMMAYFFEEKKTQK